MGLAKAQYAVGYFTEVCPASFHRIQLRHRRQKLRADSLNRPEWAPKPTCQKL